MTTPPVDTEDASPRSCSFRSCGYINGFSVQLFAKLIGCAAEIKCFAIDIRCGEYLQLNLDRRELRFETVYFDIHGILPETSRL